MCESEKKKSGGKKGHKGRVKSGDLGHYRGGF